MLLPCALWLSASTLKIAQFSFALIINPDSMGKQAQKDPKGKVSRQLNAPTHEGDSSSFSLEGNCRAQRRTARRRLTRLVHTFCFLTTAPDGSLQPLFCQLTSDSSLRTPQALRALALRQVEQHAERMGVHAVREMGKDEEVKVEEGLEESRGNTFVGGGVLAVGQGCFNW